MEKKPYMIFLAMGFELAGLVTAMIYLGRWLDQKYSWGSMGVAGGAIIALVFWLIHFIYVARKLEKESESENKSPE